MGITLYHFPPSAPSRSALLVAKALGIDADIQTVNLFAKEQLNPDFIKVNNNITSYFKDAHNLKLYLR